MRTAIALLLAVLIAPAAAFGQALADRIPGNAQIYIGWKGADDLGPGYEASHLKAVVDASQLSQFLSESVPQLIDRLTQGDRGAAEKARLVLDLLTPMLRYPTAIYFGGVELANGAPPMPKIAVLCDAGEDAPSLSQKVAQLLAQAAQGSPLRCQTFGSLVVVSTFNYADHPIDSLAQNKQFQSAMTHQIADPVVAVYVDGTALLATADALVAQFAPQAQQTWPQIRDALGLDGLKYIAATDGFDGKNWLTQISVSAATPRKGLLAPAADEPISQDFLKLIPQSASRAGACALDLNAVFTRIDSALQQFNPDAANQLHQGLQQIDQTLGFDVQSDLLMALGPQWAYYVDPSTVGSGILGFTAVNQPRNPDALQASLISLENFANVAIREQLAHSRAKLTIEIRQFASNGVIVHYLATPLISPAWAIKDGHWYGALFPQVVVSAVNRQPNGKSILDNPRYQMVMKQLNPPAQIGSFQYVDLPQTMPQGYQAWLLMSRLYLGVGDVFGAQTPPMVLPPLDKLMPEMEPSGSVSWGDENGFYIKAITPFPGADILGAGDSMTAGTIGETALMASILLPSLNRARETANRVKCASNERQISEAILLYCSAHNGVYPPDLGTLVKTEDISPDVFVCPDTGNHAPPNLTPDQACDWVNAHSDYIYIGAGLTAQATTRETVVLYEKPGNHGNDGMNIAYGDGHVEFQPLRNARVQIDRSKQTMQQQP
jgi:prepilin-type processing-associated H-X9-DG protein